MTKQNGKLVVLAIGGNSLIRDEAHKTVPDQWDLTRETCHHIARLVEAGMRVVVTHGNGPQVGFIVRRSELALHELHPVPLDSCDADTQGAIGYMIQQALGNEFRRRDIAKSSVTVVTQVEVDPNSPAFQKPTKPIGSFMDEATAKVRAEKEKWTIVEDSGRGFRRVVPSPEPLAILELDAIRTLIDAGFVVAAVGGGGIPVVKLPNGDYKGVEAVIDKDFASSLLANLLEADLFVISTAVDKVCLDYKKPTEKKLDRLTLAEAREHLAEGQFGKGSMAPKIEAVIRYLEKGGTQAIITSPEHLENAVLAGTSGTVIER
ncbi:MAG: carbamate kinase [Deltaproteobacteria bacterium]|nr:carbamate kinase [Deltaproteobacteria bacterium]